MRRRVFIPELDRRETQRTKQHVPCALMIDGQRHAGLVQDLSTHGLFVRTQAELPIGTDALVAIQSPMGKTFVVEAWVPSRRPFAHSLKALAVSGIGLRIPNPPEDYLRWVQAMAAGKP